MTQGANPFDDEYDTSNTGVAGASVSTNRNAISNNPFDDEVDKSNNDFGGGGGGGEQGVTPSLMLKQGGLNPFETRTSSFDNVTEPRDDNDDGVDTSGLPVGADSSAEASWVYLGDLPYRRVPVYLNVGWNRRLDEEAYADEEGLQHGLAAFPPSVVQQHPEMLNEREVRALLHTTTVTKVAGCPHGGPVAAVTLPIVGQSGAFAHAEIRIMNSAGVPLSKIEFPPPGLADRRYSPGDIMTIGFTDRYVLMVILRDSMCLSFGVNGEPILQPFHILTRGEGSNKTMELIQANFFDGGVAVLAASKHSAIVEFLDDHDPADYFNGAHIAARKILPSATATTEAFGGQDMLPPHYAIVTHLPTAAYARYVATHCVVNSAVVSPRRVSTS